MFNTVCCYAPYLKGFSDKKHAFQLFASISWVVEIQNKTISTPVNKHS